ncbi:MAG: hypothetical protein J6Y89_10140, partial [Lachnospiraceae bacterium]|nr:hypothetical protein [Lachnospiraceae bacterium]
MFTDKFPAIMISYPDEAPGWQNGVYHERVRKETEITFDRAGTPGTEMSENGAAKTVPEVADGPAGTPGAKICGDGVLLTARMWTETESTGFGIYPYVDGPAFVLDTGIRDVEISITVSNPTDRQIKVSCFANDILKLNGAELMPLQKASVFSFNLCSIEEKTVLQLFVPSDAKTFDDSETASVIVNDISFTLLPPKARKDKPTLFLASDSTVQSYDRFHYPQAGWGQVFYRFFNDGHLTEEQMSPDMMYPQNHIYETPGVNIENRSIGARSSRSFLNEGKWDMLRARTAPGDFCFIQWGHNDATAVRPNGYVAPADFAWWLKKYTRSCRARGVVPVLVTPIARRNCDNANGTCVASFGKYADVKIALA